MEHLHPYILEYQLSSSVSTAKAGAAIKMTIYIAIKDSGGGGESDGIMADKQEQNLLGLPMYQSRNLAGCLSHVCQLSHRLRCKVCQR